MLRERYQSQRGQASCVSCGLGQHAACEASLAALSSGGDPLAIECHARLPCATRASLPPRSYVCDMCVAGRYSDHGAQKCSLCDPGTYGEAQDRCPAGKAQPLFGQAACLLCGEGRYTAHDGVAECAACKAWEFNDGADPATGAGPTGCDECLTPGQIYGLGRPKQCSIVMGLLIGAVALPFFCSILFRTRILHCCCTLRLRAAAAGRVGPGRGSRERGGTRVGPRRGTRGAGNGAATARPCADAVVVETFEPGQSSTPSSTGDVGEAGAVTAALQQTVCWSCPPVTLRAAGAVRPRSGPLSARKETRTVGTLRWSCGSDFPLFVVSS